MNKTPSSTTPARSAEPKPSSSFKGPTWAPAPPPVMSKFDTLLSPLLRQKWLRELILLPVSVSGIRSSNKTEDYGVFEPSVLSHIVQHSLYVTDLERSRDWYVSHLGLSVSRTCEPEPHPAKPGCTLRCCYLDGPKQAETLVLMEQRDAEGRVLPVSMHGLFHLAFEIDEGSAHDFAKQLRARGLWVSYGPVKHSGEPGGDGETGGNTAFYLYDPDGHYLEFFHGMDTVENYKERYGNRKGSERG